MDESSSKAQLTARRKKSGNIFQKLIPHKFLSVIVIVLAETLATAMLIFFACMATIPFEHPLSHLGGSINAGLVVMFIVQIFGHICHSVLNPCITVAAVIHNLISWQMGIVYIIAECVGAYLGYLLLALSTPHDIFHPANHPGVCVTFLHPNVTLMQACIIEFAISSVFVTICCSVWDKKTARDSIPVKVGLTIITLLLVAGPYTGGSLNPARSLAPALYNGYWDDQWVYWVAPMLAGVVSGYAYKWFVIDMRQDPEEENTEVVELKEGKRNA